MLVQSFSKSRKRMSCASATEYDVFLSFRGSDTRCSFMSFLYKAFVDRKIRTFKDDKELQKGQSIPLDLIGAIEDSKFAVVVVSATYAASSWCLDELVKIMDLRKEGKITVMPIFYGVEPCHVRKQTGGFAEPFKKHEDRVKDPEKVRSWRRALTDLANLSGYCSSSSESADDAKLVDGIAEEISTKLVVKTSSNPGNLVGNCKHLKEIKGLLDLDSKEKLRVVGIWSRGCKNRCALATNVYHNFCQQFDKHCFLQDVEKIPHGRHSAFLNAGFMIERENSSNPKVMLVANNVSDLKHLDALAEEFDRFGRGSVVVITTPDKRLFESYGIKHVYEPECLRFQKVSAPFRSPCIKKGFSGTEDEMIYPAAVYNRIFGDELFEDYIGQFAFASTASFETRLESYQPEIGKQMLEEVMGKDREDKLTTKLKIKLEPFVKGQTDAFINWATAEAKRLSTSDFGEAMLHTVGYIYTRKAAKELGKDKGYMKVPFLAEWARDKGHQVKTLGKAVSGGISLFRMLDEVENSEATIDAMFQSRWKLHVFHIETTLSHVCQAVLKDPSVPKDVLRARARGLKKLGTIFQGEII